MTALYSLARFDKDGLSAIVQAGQVHPFLSTEDAKTLYILHGKKSPRGRKPVTEVDETEETTPMQQDLSVSIASIGIIGEGLRYPSLMAFLKELDAFVKDAANRYDCVDPRIRLSAV